MLKRTDNSMDPKINIIYLYIYIYILKKKDVLVLPTASRVCLRCSIFDLSSCEHVSSVPIFGAQSSQHVGFCTLISAPIFKIIIPRK